MRWASAATAGPDLAAALDRVLAQVRRDLGDGAPDVVFLFLGSQHAPAAVAVRDRVRAALGPVPLLGGSAAGVIGGGREYETPAGIAVVAARLPGALLRTFHVDEQGLPDADASPAAWHAQIGVPPADAPDFVLLADPFTFPVEALVAGLDFAYPRAVKVGGLASGGRGRGDQVLFAGDAVHRAGAVGVALWGNVTLAPAVAQGCRGIGPVLRVTDCEGSLLRTLDGKPALERVQDVLREASERDQQLARTSSLFLGIETDPFGPPGDEAWLVRNFLGRERDGEGLFVGEALRTGRRVRLQVRDRATSSEDLERTLAATADGPGAGCRGALLFCCGGRGMTLYGTPDHDTRAFHARFGPVPLGGFFCAGEIGPVGGTTHLHGFTSSFGLFRPKSA
jgi:small ligand-binding sensory domain FIST